MNKIKELDELFGKIKKELGCRIMIEVMYFPDDKEQFEEVVSELKNDADDFCDTKYILRESDFTKDLVMEELEITVYKKRKTW